MFRLFDVFKEILLINENIDKYIYKQIFSYVIEDYKEIINDYYIKNRIKNYSKSIFQSSTLNFHIHEYPYFIDPVNLRQKIDILLKKYNSQYHFSHFCCNETGLMYKHEDDNISKLLKLNYNY